MLEELVVPISDEAPCGEYLKDNRSVYRSYRNAFNMAQSSFRQLIEDPDALNNNELVEANAENWALLSSECENCLKTVSKDIEIFCWHAVSQLFSRKPLENLQHSLETLDYLVTNDWANLQPMSPEEKLKAEDDAGKQREWAEGRVKPLVQLVGDTAESGLLYMPLQMLTLVADIDYGKFFLAEKSGTLADLKSQALGALSSERAEVTERILSLGKIYETLVSIEKKVAEECNRVAAQGISFRFVKESVDRLLKTLRYLVEEGLPRWPLDPEEVGIEDNQPEVETLASSEEPITNGESVQTASGGMAMTGVGIVASREQALAELQKIAEYFLQAEPHSPIYMLLKRAIRWGHMPLPELLEELIGDNAVVQSRITQLAGLESAEHTVNFKASPEVTYTATSTPTPAAEKAKEPSVSPTNDVGTLTGIEW
ncbi:ImpA family type VI secretion system protein [Marinomonas posidonica]|uniref:ImpA N-terminal domain-containing protein n=1 Tax=Marinomonas posidonica (strain CECT 7376 / NCIMB 14433 / IVIA-Po-181) TaxID=491952 RepID=F6D0Y6_MARPP|nr:type VI secretion system ImpA family N-terminal domain-containing protein [Marinomonas posidonica]AEF53709.1 hypothetical protein Mar181_0653 [Marinomonas posidonica IVIA-Po-181]